VIGYAATGQADNSVTLGNASVTAVYMAEDSGAVVHCIGVNFPDGTAHYSGDANTLDDYEEGTWTPTLTDTLGNSASGYNNQVGYYTKIGRQVTLTGDIGTSNIGSCSGGIRLAGFPFTVANAANAYSSLSFGYGSGLNITANQTPTGYASYNNTYGVFQLWDSAIGTTDLQASEWSADGRVLFSVTFMI